MTPSKKIASLLLVYLTALLESPDLTAEERTDAETRLQKLRSEISA